MVYVIEGCSRWTVDGREFEALPQEAIVVRAGGRALFVALTPLPQTDIIWARDGALRGAIERLTPILMTATVTGLGLLPLALGSGNSGREIEGPMAIVILSGLIASTALNLLRLTTLAVRYGRFEKEAAA